MKLTIAALKQLMAGFDESMEITFAQRGGYDKLRLDAKELKAIQYELPTDAEDSQPKLLMVLE